MSYILKLSYPEKPEAKVLFICTAVRLRGTIRSRGLFDEMLGI